MRLALLPLALAVGALALAGCIGSPAAPGPQGEGTNPTSGEGPAGESPELRPVDVDPTVQPRLQQYPFSGKITAGAGSQMVGYVSPTGSADPHLFGFVVDQGAVAIVAELAWDQPLMDLDLLLNAPSCDATGAGTCLTQGDGMPGQGDSPVMLIVTGDALAEVGDWTLGIWAKDGANVEFRTVVTVFYGDMPPDGYTALGSQ